MVVVALGCRRAEEPATRPPEGTCLADRIGVITPEWLVRDDCGGSATECIDDCNSGDGDACFNRAIALQAADAEPADVDELFQRACLAGKSQGCTNWAASVWSGTLIAGLQCAFRVFIRTCKAKDAFGCTMVGRMLIDDAPNPIKTRMGQAQLIHSCRDLKGPPCRFLAYYEETGIFGPVDRAHIKELLRQACEGGDEDACGDHATAKETLRN